jgi:intracellular sulfur oxidation DsrE/DsrF family protein
MDSPYDFAPEFMDIVVVIHGTEIVTLVKHNYEKYKDAVERMRYYSSLGVKFKVCSLAANDFDYSAENFHDFVELVPSAMAELNHWQMQGYGLVTPYVLEKKFNIEEIR